MRRRSGGLHSEDIEEYVRLSNLSESRIGIFYDENNDQSNKRQLTKPKQSLKLCNNHYNNFEYNRSAQSSIQEEKLNEANIIVTVDIMFVMEQDQEVEKVIKSAFSIEDCNEQAKGDVTSKHRNVELLIKNKKVSKDQESVYKIWLNFNPGLSMFESYYKRMKNIFVVHRKDSNQGEIYDWVKGQNGNIKLQLIEYGDNHELYQRVLQIYQQ